VKAGRACPERTTGGHAQFAGHARVSLRHGGTVPMSDEGAGDVALFGPSPGKLRIMHTLRHYPLCPRSRSIRLVMGELRIGIEIIEETPWDLDAEFLSINPAGELPVLIIANGPTLCGTYSICEYVAEELKRHPVDGHELPLFPGRIEERAEVRRLVDWSHGKLDREVTQEALAEKLYSRYQSSGAVAPNAEAIRAMRANLRYNLSYFGFLLNGRHWLAGEDLSFADLAAAAQLSVLDYLDEISWDEHPAVKEWYSRLKSRKSFRGLLGDRLAGVAPPAHYADLDF